MENKVWVVVTTTNEIGQDLICDVILITEDMALAEITCDRIKKKEPISGVDYSLLTPFEDAAYFSRKLNSLNCWGGNNEPK